MRWASLCVALVACSGASTVIDGGDPDTGVDATDDHKIGDSPDVTVADVGVDAPPDVVMQDAVQDVVTVDAGSDVTEASTIADSGPVFDLDALAYCAAWSCKWSDVWSPQVTEPPNYTCVRCIDNGACSPSPWANGCDAGTVYDPVISPYDGSSSVIDFCVPNSCPPK